MRILMMEGNTPKLQQKAEAMGVRTASDIYSRAIHFFNPEAIIDVVEGTEGEFLPAGKSYADYQGLVISGSSLHAYDQTPEVLNQIEGLNRFAETGKPILGSCWGLQIAAVAAGGEVGLSPNGRELGIARKILLTEAGQIHPFMAGKPSAYDAPCIHYDEVTVLPEQATLLSGNRHSPVQAAIIPVGQSEVWGVQYHPEFDIAQLRMLFELYQEDMLKQGFVTSDDQYQTLVHYYRQLEAKPDDTAIAWQLGIDQDVLNDELRGAEICNWLKYLEP